MKGCSEWEKYRDKDGYGIAFHRGKAVRAHRLAYCQDKGIELQEINGLVVRHLCNNPCCVNSEHLAIGTHLDNALDRQLSGHTNHPTGEKNPNAKISSAQAQEIRLRFKNGETKSQRLVGMEYSLTQSAVSRILKGESWGHTK